jgi:hypothetical protein
MMHSTRAQERQFAELKKEVTKRGADREGIQKKIVFPPQIQREWHYVLRHTLLFTATGVIHLLASIWPEQEPQITSLSGCSLMYLEAVDLFLAEAEDGRYPVHVDDQLYDRHPGGLESEAGLDHHIYSPEWDLQH